MQLSHETVGKEGGGGKRRKRNAHVAVVQSERELLSCICSLQGQAVVARGAGSVASTRTAMEAFLQSAK